MRQLVKLLPSEDLIYFGDTGRVPYGGKSSETIVNYSRQDVAFLKQFNLKAILIACGTVSTTALSVLRKENNIPIIGVVEPAVKAALMATRNKRIGIIGTKATIRSGAYSKAILTMDDSVSIESKACPLFVPLVEEGRVELDDSVTELIVSEYLCGMKEKDIDTLVLGCTHYPLLQSCIRKYMGQDVRLIDTGLECSIALKQLLEVKDMLADSRKNGSQMYYASDSADDFKSIASVFLGYDLEGRVERVDIDKY